MKIRRLIQMGLAGTAGLLSVLAINLGQAMAAGNNCAWTGAGDGINFSDATNWSGCGGVAPGTGDNLIFDNSGLSTLTALTNDISNLSVANITYQGANPNFDYTLVGNGITITNGITNSSGGSFGINNDIVFTGAQNLNVGSLYDVDLFGNLTGTGHLTLTGGGSLRMGGDNSGFSGGISDGSGYLSAETATALGTGTTTITDGGTLLLVFDSDTTFDTPLSLGGNGVSGDPSSAALYMNTQSFSGDDSTATWSGPITLTSNILVGGFGNRILKVAGPLSGNFTMTPATADSNGVILIQSSNNTSNTPSGYVPVKVASGDNQPGVDYTIDKLLTFIVDGTRGQVTVLSGGTLMGGGTVGDLTVNQGGHLAPGHSPGCMNTGNLSLNGSFDAEIGGTTACTEYDQMNVTGTVDVTGSTLNTTLYNGYKPKAGESYTVIKNDGADAVTGTFTGLPEGATFKVSGYVFKVTYKGGDGNDVVLSIVSVPSTPNTGIGRITTSSGMTLGISTLSGLGILAIAQRSKKSAETIRRR